MNRCDTYFDGLACLDARQLGNLYGPAEKAARQAQRQAQQAARQQQQQAQRAARQAQQQSKRDNQAKAQAERRMQQQQAQAAKRAQQQAAKAARQQPRTSVNPPPGSAIPRKPTKVKVRRVLPQDRPPADYRRLYRADGEVQVKDPRYLNTFNAGKFRAMTGTKLNVNPLWMRQELAREAEEAGRPIGTNPILWDTLLTQYSPDEAADMLGVDLPRGASSSAGGGGGGGGGAITTELAPPTQAPTATSDGKSWLDALLDLLFGWLAPPGTSAFASSISSGYSDGDYIDPASTTATTAISSTLPTFGDPYAGANPQLGSWLSDAFRGKGGPLAPLVGAIGMIPGVGGIASAIGTAAFAKKDSKNKKPKPAAVAPAPPPVPAVAPAGISPGTALALGAIALLALRK